MPKPDTLEVTITHNLPDKAEVRQLFTRRLIAIDWGREWGWKSTEPDKYDGRAKIDLTTFHDMKAKGAAVIAAYKGATAKAEHRLVGWVEQGAEFVMLNGLLCLPLTRVKVVDSASSFLGNLAPRQCTVQACHERAKGRLSALVRDVPIDRSVWSLHHRDVEWLVTNYLLTAGRCAAVWGGGQSFESIDHAGYTHAGREVLAQTTVSGGLVGRKAERLKELTAPGRDLLMFGPEKCRRECPAGIEYISIESVFAALDITEAGRWLIDRMTTIIVVEKDTPGMPATKDTAPIAVAE